MAALQIPAALLLILLATFWPLPGAPPRFELRFDLADALVNLALFLPLGAALRSAGWRRGRILVASLLLSLRIELTQGTLVPGRRGNPFDPVFNTVGAAAGIWLPGLPAAVLALPALAWLGSGPLLLPCVPDTRQWWGQWAHHFGGTVPYTGRVRGVTFAGSPAPDDALDSTRVLRARALRDGWMLRVDLTSGAPPAGVAHLAGIADGEGNFLIAFEQRERELLITWRSRGACAGLRPVRWVVPVVLPESPGAPFTLEARVRGLRAEVSMLGPDETITRSLWLMPWAGWRSLVAGPAPSRAIDLAWSGLWSLAGLGALVLWLRRVRAARSP